MTSIKNSIFEKFDCLPMEQIEANHYADGYLNDGRKVVCIGANFNSETKNIDDCEVK